VNDRNIRLGVLAGRLMVGLYYLFVGLDNLLNLLDQAHYAAFGGVPLSLLAMAVASLLFLLGGVCILIGYRPELGIAAIVLFTIPTTLITYDFWNVADPQARVEVLRAFLSNLGLSGSALIFLSIPRPWAWSIEEMQVARTLYRTVRQSMR
jgi:putative oxidoreductase